MKLAERNSFWMNTGNKLRITVYSFESGKTHISDAFLSKFFAYLSEISQPPVWTNGSCSYSWYTWSKWTDRKECASRLWLLWNFEFSATIDCFSQRVYSAKHDHSDPHQPEIIDFCAKSYKNCPRDCLSVCPLRQILMRTSVDCLMHFFNKHVLCASVLTLISCPSI